MTLKIDDFSRQLIFILPLKIFAVAKAAAKAAKVSDSSEGRGLSASIAKPAPSEPLPGFKDPGYDFRDRVAPTGPVAMSRAAQ